MEQAGERSAAERVSGVSGVSGASERTQRATEGLIQNAFRDLLVTPLALPAATMKAIDFTESDILLKT